MCEVCAHLSPTTRAQRALCAAAIFLRAAVGGVRFPRRISRLIRTPMGNAAPDLRGPFLITSISHRQFPIARGFGHRSREESSGGN